jgi:ActR/RegA family two-component response regulator
MSSKALIVTDDQPFLATLPLAFRQQHFYVVAVGSRQQ